jgi:hypothetical protein
MRYWLVHGRQQGNAAMTNQTAQLHARYARMYAVGILTLMAVTIGTAASTQLASPAPAMDVTAIMGSIDTASLPVQGHVDAF